MAQCRSSTTLHLKNNAVTGSHYDVVANSSVAKAFWSYTDGRLVQLHKSEIGLRIATSKNPGYCTTTRREGNIKCYAFNEFRLSRGCPVRNSVDWWEEFHRISRDKCLGKEALTWILRKTPSPLSIYMWRAGHENEIKNAHSKAHSMVQ